MSYFSHQGKQLYKLTLNWNQFCTFNSSVQECMRMERCKSNACLLFIQTLWSVLKELVLSKIQTWTVENCFEYCQSLNYILHLTANSVLWFSMTQYKSRQDKMKWYCVVVVVIIRYLIALNNSMFHFTLLFASCPLPPNIKCVKRQLRIKLREVCVMN